MFVYYKIKDNGRFSFIKNSGNFESGTSGTEFFSGKMSRKSEKRTVQLKIQERK